MTTIRRTAVAAAAAAALVLAPAAGASAAKPEGGQLRQLLKDVDRFDSKLAKVAGSTSMTRLADEHESVLVAGIESDRAELATLATAAQADPAHDTRAARRELRDLRVQNYKLAITIVRGVERATEEAAALPEAAAELALALDGALAVRDETDKRVVKEAREHLRVALELLEDAAVDGGVEDEVEVDPEAPEQLG